MIGAECGMSRGRAQKSREGVGAGRGGYAGRWLPVVQHLVLLGVGAGRGGSRKGREPEGVSPLIPVSVTKNTPPEKRTLGKTSLSKSGAGEQLPLKDCMAKARVKGLFFHRHR